MKRKFEEPQIEVIDLEKNVVVITSCVGADDEEELPGCKIN